VQYDTSIFFLARYQSVVSIFSVDEEQRLPGRPKPWYLSTKLQYVASQNPNLNVYWASYIKSPFAAFKHRGVYSWSVSMEKGIFRQF